MNTVVIKVTPSVMKKMKETYNGNLVNKKVPYSEFTAKKSGTAITAYTSGKVMFQGDNAQREAALWGAELPKKKKHTGSSDSSAKSAKLPANFSQLSVVGSDEVGNGSYFGPVTVCAAYADKEHLSALKALGVKDSKALTDKQIRQLAEKIKELIPFQLLVVNPEKYNQIQPTYNAVRMKVALHNQAIGLLLDKLAPVTPEAILIDQFTPEGNYNKYVSLEKTKVNQKIYFTTKGEQYHLAVAAASIISRASFLDELDAASVELGLTVPSGAGHKSDEVAAKVLRKGGIELLGKYAKLHFANTEKAKKLVK
ncbi:ribonuclease HIII [Enterococcus sp. JM4C]|uniref:ribonuclease HIII n=1 Tax=Candidatus Enterococcus huntleyi TaxID=1857217 RepID=UPI00137B6A94|nr:ribonuclease HIII [Enterococcus sp. JM4C]KAF1295702.1 ribonuclease HIII [Enterococcus sp. JM4C]